MNKYLVSVALLLNSAPAILGTTIPDCAVICPSRANYVPAFSDFIIETQIDEITPMHYHEWALIKHDELELIDYSFTIDKSMFKRAGHQSWIFKVSRPGTYNVSFMRNGETKIVSVYAYHDWCGTEPRAETPIITFK